MSVGDDILDILDEVLWEECGIMRFEALYLGGDEPLSESELFGQTA
jgi:hypothetical protein